MRREVWMAAMGVAICFSVTGEQPAAVRGYGVPATTSTPFTYCIWYLPDPDSVEFLGALRASPPDLFHLGFQIPFKGALGPTYGHELFTDAILAPEQVPREEARIRNIIRQMRDSGVARIIPYVYSMAFFGNPDNRTGFFHFYDCWDRYEGFGLGPRPAADPALWSQVRGPNPLGGGPADVLHYEPCVNHPGWLQYLDLVVRQLAAVGYDGMFFDVNNQYCYCPHCQEQFDVYLLNKYGRAGLREIFGTDDHRVLNIPTIYRDFEELILSEFEDHLRRNWNRRNLGRILDAESPATVKLEEDWRLLRCYMQDSQGEYPPEKDFADYLKGKFGADEARKVAEEKRADFVQTVLRRQFRQFLESRELSRLLQSRLGSADIRRRCCANSRDLLLWVETQRFWCQSMASLFARLKEAGRKVLAEQGRSQDFFTVANLGSMSTLDSLNKRRVDGMDLVTWAPMTDMQMFEEMPQPGSLESGVIISNIFAFRWAFAAGTRAGTLLYKVADDRAADLAHAESAAGGGGAFIQPALDAPESRRRWKRFFAEHADLWEGGASYAQVALLFWSDQVFYEYPEHLAMVRRLIHVLSETQVPFDLVVETGAHTLPRYRLVIAPMLRYLDDEQIETLLDYAKGGGNLLIVEPFGTEDRYARPRARDALGGACSTVGTGVARYGRGQVMRIAAEDVPQRRSDAWCLMEERANAFVRAGDYLNKARQADLAQGVDLGPEFIRRVEELFAAPLRWCPPETDAGIYLHAYHLPAKSGRPERIVVHAVNYRVPIVLEKGETPGEDPTFSPQTRSGEPVSARNLQVRVPLPGEKSVGTVAGFSPVGRASTIQWTVHEDHVLLAIGELSIYQAVAIELTT